MDINKICPGCMHEVENRESVGKCPHCGYDFTHMAAASHQLQPFTILAGKYLVGRVIGEGGFGISYLGYDLNLELVVAIKEFYPNGFVTRESNHTTQVTMYSGKNESDVNKWRDSFINEAKNLAKFSNLNGIVEVRDFFNENSTAYIVMEYIDGITLKQYLKQNGGKISVDQTLNMMDPVIRSLSKVHDAGMIHRDISPDNIMITKYGGMKLLDFGAAREFAGNAEKSLSIMLKPGYAPEEQYRSHGKQGPWSDVYALTATIYKCITGVTPVESMERMRDDPLKMPGALGVKMTPAQEAAIRQGMAVYAEDRIQNMDALHMALYGGQAPVDAPRSAPTPAPAAEPAVQEQPQIQSAEIKKPEIKKPEISVPKVSKQYVMIGVGAACVLILIVVILALVPKSSKSKDTDRASAADVSASDLDSPAEAVPEQEEMEDMDELQVMLVNKQYAELIDEVLRMDSDEFYEDEDHIREYARQALVGHMNTALAEADSLAADGDYDGAFAKLDEELSYRNRLKSENRLYPNADDSSELETKREELSSQYVNYVDEIANERAAEKDLDGMEAVLADASGRLSEDDYERISHNAYRTLVILIVDEMTSSGYDPYVVMAYIDGFFEETGYNGYIMELWDVQNNASGRMSTWNTSITHVSANGYLLGNSATQYISESDIYSFSQYELYMARWEIYARHNRRFVDNAVTGYFNNYGWYSGTISPVDFDDDNVLNDYEKENIKTIINYEKKCGYR